MNATNNAKDEIAMKINQLPLLCFERISEKTTISHTDHKITNPLTCKPATHKEGHCCILYWSYAQTSILPKTQKKTAYYPVPVQPMIDESNS
jgi:hypothetical protein